MNQKHWERLPTSKHTEHYLVFFCLFVVVVLRFVAFSIILTFSLDSFQVEIFYSWYSPVYATNSYSLKINSCGVILPLFGKLCEMNRCAGSQNLWLIFSASQ